MNNTIIDIENLSVGFRNGDDILSDVNFAAQKGTFISIVGKSGSGKTTLLNCIAGFQKYRGQIIRTQNIAYVFQDRALFPWMTVRGNILFGLDDKTDSERVSILQNVMQKIELVGLEKRYPHELSGGQAQRVALARSIANDSELVLCDEPFSALDTITKENLVEWFLSIIDGKKTFLFVTHNIEDAIILSDQVLILKDKKVLEPIEIAIERNERAQMRNSEKMLVYRRRIDSIVNS